MLGVDVKDKILSGRNVPEAAVDVDILNVSFGGVVYQSVTESEVSYIGWGGRHTAHTGQRNHLSYILFFFGFSGITVNNGEKDRFWIGFRKLILANRSFILLILISYD